MGTLILLKFLPIVETWCKLKCLQAGMVLGDLLWFYETTSIESDEQFSAHFGKTFFKKGSCKANTSYC